MSEYLRRTAETELNDAIDSMRIVLISGARQCGKTTLMKALLSEKDLFLTFDDPETLRMALAEPSSFLRPFLKKYRRIAIDEVQKAPELFGYMKMIVDSDPIPGKFVITGSANYKAMPTVNESLAGRLGEVRLRTMTNAEINCEPQRNFINQLLSGEFPRVVFDPEECSKEVILGKAIAGGYPSVHNLSRTVRKRWFKGYLTALFERDLADLGHFENKGVMDKILNSVCLNSSRPINFNELATILGIDIRTAARYVAALKTMFLIEEVPAWSNKLFERLSKAPVFYAADTGLMSAVLGHYDVEPLELWARRNEKAGSDFIGNLIETWVFNQIAPVLQAADEWHIFHLRVYQRQEIDFVLENEQGELILLEVKASESVTTDDFRHINWFKERAGNKVLVAAVLYTGQTVRDFGDNKWALPMILL